MLDALPTEIVDMVADRLPPPSLWALRQTSSRLHTVLVPRLYSTLTFRAASEWALSDLNVDRVLESRGSGPPNLTFHHTRHVQVTAPFHFARFNRCAYHRIGYASSLRAFGEPTAHQRFLDTLSGQLRRAFVQLNPHTLRSFRWHLGTCLPAGVLDGDGYFAAQQKSIRSLALITDGTCPHAGHRVEGLPQLRALTELSWEGIQHPREMHALRECLQRNGAQLTNLSVGFVSSANAPNHLACALGLGELEPWVAQWTDVERDSDLFPALLSLSLSNFRFPDLISLGAAPSLFHRLQKLTLRDCDNQLQVLRTLTQSAESLRLRHLEMCNDDLLQGPSDPSASLAIIEFLLSFQGLQHLHLRVSNFPQSVPGLQDAVRHHQSTLQSLIYHERQLVPIDNDRTFEDVRDVSPGWAREIPQLLYHSAATALGLCLNPVAAREFLQPVADRAPVRLLHLRFSGAEHLHRDMHREIVSALCRKRDRRARSVPLGRCEIHASALDNVDNSVLDGCSCCTAVCGSAVPEIGPITVYPEAREFLAFAEWAFGPTGLPTLQVLAFGDFSRGERYRRQQFVVRRNAYADRCRYGTHDVEDGFPFRTADATNSLLWDDLPISGLDFLSACPGSGLFESPYDL
ncbi:hypothetical protein BBP40_004013 [Aspergillus hancockii]|nr:hypothetical protein BBP40_004013 [Aspergillus hancockii]